MLGRVEAIEFGAEPVLPADLLRARTTEGAFAKGPVSDAFCGKWWGSVSIKCLQSYPEQHGGEPYCLQFIVETQRYFKYGKRGQIVLSFLRGADGALVLDTSDVSFARGLKIQLTTSRGPALVSGGFNMPLTVSNDLSQLTPRTIEQTRIDAVTVVDRLGTAVHSGFTEVSCLLKLEAPRRMHLKILNIDYDQDGKPLWKVFLEGQALR